MIAHHLRTHMAILFDVLVVVLASSDTAHALLSQRFHVVSLQLWLSVNRIEDPFSNEYFAHYVDATCRAIEGLFTPKVECGSCVWSGG